MNYHRVFVENSYVFLTIVTSKRRPILINNIELLKKSIKKAHYNFGFDIIAICILPDHIHLLIKLYNIKDYPNIIRQLKTHFSKNFDISKIEDYELSESNIDKQERDIWQRRYWEHTIVSQEDLYRHIDYIHYNPIKHGFVKAAKEWEFSSFRKFVEKKYYNIDWYNFEDKYEIKDLDWE